MKPRRYLITGGPGTGKTTIVQHLGILGYSTRQEAARKVIEWNLRNGGQILPWVDRDLFDSHLLSIMKKDYKAKKSEEAIVFDGSVLDIIAWRKLLGRKTDNFEYTIEDFIFEKKVFIPPPWKEIYFENDARPFKFVESARISNAIAKFYEKLGYEVIMIPKLSPMKRAQMISKIIMNDNLQQTQKSHKRSPKNTRGK